MIELQDLLWDPLACSQTNMDCDSHYEHLPTKDQSGRSILPSSACQAYTMAREIHDLSRPGQYDVLFRDMTVVYLGTTFVVFDRLEYNYIEVFSYN